MSRAAKIIDDLKTYVRTNYPSITVQDTTEGVSLVMFNMSGGKMRQYHYIRNAMTTEWLKTHGYFIDNAEFISLSSTDKRFYIRLIDSGIVEEEDEEDETPPKISIRLLTSLKTSDEDVKRGELDSLRTRNAKRNGKVFVCVMFAIILLPFIAFIIFQIMHINHVEEKTTKPSRESNPGGSERNDKTNSQGNQEFTNSQRFRPHSTVPFIGRIIDFFDSTFNAPLKQQQPTPKDIQPQESTHKNPDQNTNDLSKKINPTQTVHTARVDSKMSSKK